MQQTVLITAVRGPDGLHKEHISKDILRWLRRCILFSAFDKCVLTDPVDQRGGNFTGPVLSVNTSWTVDELINHQDKDLHEILKPTVKQFLNSVDELPHHFLMHVTHAAEILGYLHPDPEVQAWWLMFYHKLVRDLHMQPESHEDMLRRLGDNQTDWQAVGGEVLIRKVDKPVFPPNTLV